MRSSKKMEILGGETVLHRFLFPLKDDEWFEFEFEAIRSITQEKNQMDKHQCFLCPLEHAHIGVVEAEKQEQHQQFLALQAIIASCGLSISDNGFRKVKHCN